MKLFFKISVLISILVVTVFFFLKSGDDMITFTKIIGGKADDRGNDIITTSDGGYAIIGTSSSFGEGSSDMYLVKTDKKGTVLWAKTFGSIETDSGKSIDLTPDGGYILLGTTTSTKTRPSENFYYLVKADKDGNEQWEKTFGGKGNYIASTVLSTHDNGYILFGHRFIEKEKMFDFYLIKTDEDGNKQWEKTFGGNQHEWSSCIIETSDGGYLLAGNTDSYSNGAFDMYLIKIDKDGNKQWEKMFGRDYDETARSIFQTDDNGYAIFGWSNSYTKSSIGEPESDLYLIKMDKDQNKQWEKIIGDPELYERGHSMDRTPDGGYVLVGNIKEIATSSLDEKLSGSKPKLRRALNQNVYFLKVDKDGNEVWSKSIGGNKTEYGKSVKSTGDGGFVIIGSTQSYGAGQYDVLFIKTDENGDVSLW